MRKFTQLFLLVIAPILAQTQESGSLFNRAPAGVEDALRARVKQFFDLQQEGKFRQAESMVCEDTKDHYYNMDKQKHKSSEMGKVFWDEGYKSARVQVNLDVTLATMIGPMPTKFPMMSYWRLEGSNWCYFVPQRNKDYYETPFGTMKRNPDAPDASGGPPKPVPVDMSVLRQSLKASKSEMTLSAVTQSRDEVELKNTLPGGVTLKLDAPNLPGLKTTLDKTELGANETAKLVVEFTPVNKNPQPPVKVRIRVDPSGQALMLGVSFTKAK